jgi:UDPglucose 6-dehydrogenase
MVGSGYVGLVSAACFAEFGNDVYCIDIDREKVDKLKKGVLPIYEPGLEDMVKRNCEQGRLKFDTQMDEAVKQSDIIFIAVQTPQDTDGSADLKYVLAAAETIARAMNGYKIIVNKSTVPVGTAEKVRARVASITKHPFSVVSNPEFLKEGAAIDDFLKPDRVVIGTDHPRAAEVMKELYRPYVMSGNPVLLMDNKSAEVTKYAANALLATKISFINEMAMLCERVGADIKHVRAGMCTDRRIGFHFYYPGVGYGGSCLPKDVQAIIKTGREHDCGMDLLQAVEQINFRHKELLFDKFRQHFKQQIRGKTVGILGLSFKPNTDDIREAPSLVMIRKLRDAGVAVRVHDPVAIENTRKILGNHVIYCKDCYEAVSGTDALFLMTEWSQYRLPDFDRIRSLMKSPVVFDGRNIYNSEYLKEKGFTYYGIGRGSPPDG